MEESSVSTQKKHLRAVYCPAWYCQSKSFSCSTSNAIQSACNFAFPRCTKAFDPPGHAFRSTCCSQQDEVSSGLSIAVDENEASCRYFSSSRLICLPSGYKFSDLPSHQNKRNRRTKVNGFASTKLEKVPLSPPRVPTTKVGVEIVRKRSARNRDGALESSGPTFIKVLIQKGI